VRRPAVILAPLVLLLAAFAPVAVAADGAPGAFGGSLLLTPDGRIALRSSDGGAYIIHENLVLERLLAASRSAVPIATAALVYEYRGEQFLLFTGPAAEAHPGLVPEGTEATLTGEVTLGEARPTIKVASGPYAGRTFTILENRALEAWEAGNALRRGQQDATGAGGTTAVPPPDPQDRPGSEEGLYGYALDIDYGEGARESSDGKGYTVSGTFCGVFTQFPGDYRPANYFIIAPCPPKQRAAAQAPKKKGGGGKKKGNGKGKKKRRRGSRPSYGGGGGGGGYGSGGSPSGGGGGAKAPDSG